MTATVTHLPARQPQPAPVPHPSSVAIAADVLKYGYGPEMAAYLVEGFEHAGVLFGEIVTSMAWQSGFASPEEYLSWTGSAAILAASGPVR